MCVKLCSLVGCPHLELLFAVGINLSQLSHDVEVLKLTVGWHHHDCVLALVECEGVFSCRNREPVFLACIRCSECVCFAEEDWLKSTLCVTEAAVLNLLPHCSITTKCSCECKCCLRLAGLLKLCGKCIDHTIFCIHQGTLVGIPSLSVHLSHHIDRRELLRIHGHCAGLHIHVDFICSRSNCVGIVLAVALCAKLYLHLQCHRCVRLGCSEAVDCNRFPAVGSLSKLVRECERCCFCSL